MYMIYIWLAVICIGLLVEVQEAGTLVSIWFSVGAVVPLIMSFWRINSPVYIAIQIIVFGVVTILSLIFLRKFAKKALFKNIKEKTNMDALMGKKYKISRVDGEIEYVKINGIEYRALDEKGDSEFDLHDQVEIIRIEGNKIIVKKVEKGE